MDGTPTSPVNSHNGWSPADEVIVGEPTHLAYHDDVSYRLFFCANLDSETPPGSTPPWIVPADRATCSSWSATS